MPRGSERLVWWEACTEGVCLILPDGLDYTPLPDGLGLPRCPHCPTGGLKILGSKRFKGEAPVLITYLRCTNRDCNTLVTAIKEEF
jgi:hypothetical protein